MKHLVGASKMTYILNTVKQVGYLRFKDTGRDRWIIICVQTEYKI